MGSTDKPRIHLPYVYLNQKPTRQQFKVEIAKVALPKARDRGQG